MDTNFGKFEMLALRTTTHDELKHDVNNATSFSNGSSMMFRISVGLCDRKQNFIENVDCRNCSFIICDDF